MDNRIWDYYFGRREIRFCKLCPANNGSRRSVPPGRFKIGTEEISNIKEDADAFADEAVKKFNDF